ncbi:MAG: hypothetical protein ABSG26_17160 [Bryobacteraceae bacterium]|jgi:hypothetical protein
MAFRIGAAWNGNSKQTFRKGNPTAWQRGQSGNPTGKPAGLVAFELKFAEALAGQGTPEELAKLIWDSARKGESWAVLKLAERFEWPREDAAEDHELVIKVVYVERDTFIVAKDASGASEDHPGITAIQRLLPGPSGGQDGVGDGSADPPGAGGPADGLVQPDVSPIV